METLVCSIDKDIVLSAEYSKNIILQVQNPCEEISTLLIEREAKQTLKF